MREFSPKLRKAILGLAKTGRAEDILAGYRQSTAKKDEALEQELLNIIKTRTDFLKDDWVALLHGSPNNSDLARLAKDRLNLSN